MTDPIILSIHDGHNASAALFKGLHILAAVSEERLNRDKAYWGFPKLSIEFVLDMAELNMDDVNMVTVSHLSTFGYIKRKLSSRDTYTLNLKHFLGHLYNIWQAWNRERIIRTVTNSKNKKTYYFSDHHTSHAASAYYFSDCKDALVVTLDGLGDSLSHTAFDVRKGEWKSLVRGGSNSSLGLFYAAVTEELGFKPNRHEGKIVGLAALGNPDVAQKYLRKCVSISDDGQTFTRLGYNEIRGSVREALLNNISMEDIAACAQSILEEIAVEHIRALLSETGQKNLVCAGGVFANVKLNQRIAESCNLDYFFVQPAMGDEGLVLGSPFLSQKHENVEVSSKKIKDVYLGNLISEEDIYKAAESIGASVEILKDPFTEVARFIDKGLIVGWVDGRMEFGPRALGSRSILADPRRGDINEVINIRLNRSEFMPFAPSVLIEDSDSVFSIIKGTRHAAEFMTITYNVLPEWRSKIPSVVHVDGTARPQLVSKETNPNYHAVINEFKLLTGVPLVINTSFNLHEEPIVSTASDAARALDLGAVDVVIYNGKFKLSK